MIIRVCDMKAFGGLPAVISKNDNRPTRNVFAIHESNMNKKNNTIIRAGIQRGEENREGE